MCGAPTRVVQLAAGSVQLTQAVLYNSLICTTRFETGMAICTTLDGLRDSHGLEVPPLELSVLEEFEDPAETKRSQGTVCSLLGLWPDSP